MGAGRERAGESRDARAHMSGLDEEDAREAALLRGMRAFLAREARVPETRLGLDAPLLTSGLLDSMGIVRLATWLERELGIEIPDADLAPEHFDSLAAILAYTRRRGAA